MKLNAKQSIALDYLEDNITREVEYGGGAGGGKSILGCYWQIKRRLKYPGTRGLIGRSSLKTLKETTLLSFFEVCQMQGLKSGLHYTYNQQANTIIFSNGSKIFLKDLFQYPSDPNFDELGSLEITDAFIDENNQIVEKAWNVVKSRIRYKLTDYDLIPKIMGSCNPSKGWIYDKFYKPFKKGELPIDRKFVQALAGDNPDISKYYIENLKTLDENSKQRLLLGNWEYDDDPSALCSYDNILALFDNDHVQPSGTKYIIADVARLGSDKAVIGVWDGLILIEVYEYAISLTTDIQNTINALRTKHGIPKNNCLGDEDGVGGGVIDNCGIIGFTNNGKPIENNDQKENYFNLQSQCGFYLAKQIQANTIYISAELTTAQREAIIQELEQLKSYGTDKDGKARILPKASIKDNIGRSPDYRDMLLMRMFFELKPKTFNRIVRSSYI